MSKPDVTIMVSDGVPDEVYPVPPPEKFVDFGTDFLEDPALEKIGKALVERRAGLE
jgi:hypothetical protein